MGNRFLNLVLALTLIVSVGLIWVRRSDPAQPNVEFLPDMAHSPAYEALSASPVFPDGKTLQAPVTGTVPRGFLPLPYQATPEDAVRAGQELSNAFKLGDSKAVDRGSFVYANFCTPCHGGSGKGDGLVPQRGYPPPPSLLAEHARDLTDGQMFHLLSFGQGNMAQYATALSREDRWKVILHVRSLQSSAREPAPISIPR